jgi:hypothetical protein
MQHIASVNQTHPVTASVVLHDGSRSLVGLSPCPIALKFEEHLQPARELGSGCFHSPKSEFMTLTSETTASIRDYKNLEVLFES